MRIEILSEAEDDLVAGPKFYERRRSGLGEYFLNSLYSDIDSLLLYVGIHRLIFGSHRALSKRRILDLRRDPLWIRERFR
jgi:hypothetical protein